MEKRQGFVITNENSIGMNRSIVPFMSRARGKAVTFGYVMTPYSSDSTQRNLGSSRLYLYNPSEKKVLFAGTVDNLTRVAATLSDRTDVYTLIEKLASNHSGFGKTGINVKLQKAHYPAALVQDINRRLDSPLMSRS